jgi:Lrp/AsnC family transcriptional regulator
MANPAGLDRTDRRILSILQEDAALTIGQLSEMVNLSHNPCWRRVKRLEDEGYIRKRVALVDPAKLGAGVVVFVTVRAAEHSDEWLAAFAKAVRDIPEVMEFYRMSGDIDYLLKLRVADIPAYDAVYKRLIQSVRLLDISSAFAMEEMKCTTAVPVLLGSPSSPPR